MKMSNLKVAVVMGSDSDLPVVEKGLSMLKQFGISYDVHVISAHRTPQRAEQFASGAIEDGVGVIIAAAGKAAHLAGVIAAYTTRPVIGLPIKSSTLDGLDSLLSIVQMPKGIPVATVAIDGAENAAILAAQILSLSDSDLSKKLADFKIQMAQEVEQKDSLLKQKIAK
jgi:5-(carboxyamino)imidazole ribonucleotide mutase